MPTSHRRYPLEYRERLIEFVRSGRSPESRAREPSARCLSTKPGQAEPSW